ncbi:MAG: phage holin family protein [Candidatus Methylacidiphilales bacterium]
MLSMIFRWLFTMLTVWVAAYLIPGIQYDSWQALAIAALVLGLLNAVLRPILLLLSLPFLLVTLGLFLFVINALMLKLTAFLVPGFTIEGFWSALGGALIISLINLFAGTNVKARTTVTRSTDSPRNGPKPPPGSGPIIDI